VEPPGSSFLDHKSAEGATEGEAAKNRPSQESGPVGMQTESGVGETGASKCPVMSWWEDRTGWSKLWKATYGRIIPGGASWCRVWPSAILFTLVVQAITGFILWGYYSPSAQTAWESVYYIQYILPGGWLVRGIHHYSAQVLVALVGIYVLHLIFSGGYRAPRELVFWTALIMLVLSLGGCLTGDLLCWDQNAYSATLVRVRFLLLIPWIGDDLFALAAGGPSFGHHTLSRFFSLHVGVIATGFGLIFAVHHWFLRRAEALDPAHATPQCAICSGLRRFWFRQAGKEKLLCEKSYGEPYWPNQFWRNAVVWLAVLGVIFLLVFHPWEYVGTDAATHTWGVGLLAPADQDPARAYAAARPEWSFRGLYQLTKLFPGEAIPGLGLSWQIVPVFVLPGLTALFFILMPFIARWSYGHLINIVVTSVIVLALVVLSWTSFRHDAHSSEYLLTVAEGKQLATRVRQLAEAYGGFPPGGGLALIAGDPKVRGLELFKKHCVICHNYSGPSGLNAVSEKPSAPELFGFATREWIAGLLDPKRVGTAEYFGNTRFAASAMVRYVQTRFVQLSEEDQQAIITALAAEAQEDVSGAASWQGDERLQRGRQLIVEHCTQCHRYEGRGPVGFVPVLDGYGSYEWVVGILMDPGHGYFYGARNDRMPSYLAKPGDPAANRLRSEEVAVLAQFVRGKWYEPPSPAAKGADAGGPQQGGMVQGGLEPPEPPLLVAGRWEARQVAVSTPAPGDNDALGRWLYQKELCSLCHNYTGHADVKLDIVAEKPSAPDLGGFGSREWIAGMLDPKQVAGPKYFGNSAFANGDMVKFVRGNLRELVEEIGRDELDRLIDGLAKEAERDQPAAPDEVDEDLKLLFEDFTCADCHKFYDIGGGSGPDLTAYGSKKWTADIIADPAHRRFYGQKNDGMPSYRAFPAEEDHKNLMSQEELELLAEWIRKPLKAASNQAESQPQGTGEE